MDNRENKKNVAFIFDHQYEDTWRDGLWAALQLLKDDFNITMVNLRKLHSPIDTNKFDFFLGWGAFNSPVDIFMQALPSPKGLCIGGTAMPPKTADMYDILFYETDWYEPLIKKHKKTIHAFGVNTDIYKPLDMPKVLDYITVGAFSLWKRQNLLIQKKGLKLAVGEIQKENLGESLDIIGELLLNGVMVMDMVAPEELAKLYNISRKAYIPCELHGGGERAVLEARACGLDVEIESDNPKLQELINCEVYDHHYYYQKLKKGIKACL